MQIGDWRKAEKDSVAGDGDIVTTESAKASHDLALCAMPISALPSGTGVGAYTAARKRLRFAGALTGREMEFHVFNCIRVKVGQFDSVAWMPRGDPLHGRVTPDSNESAPHLD